MKKALDPSNKGRRRLDILASKGVSASDAAAGTMVVSQLPLTALSNFEKSSMTISTRLQSFYVFIQPHIPWRGAVVYGIPRGANHPNSDSFTEEILEAWLLDQEKEHLDRPSFLAGDFNRDVSKSPTIKKILSRGWVDVAEFFEEHRGIPLAKTSKNATRIDRIYVHPGIIPYLELWETQKFYQDHAWCRIRFQTTKDCHLIPMFRKPEAIDYSAIDEDLLNEFAQDEINRGFDSTSSSSRFQSIFQIQEEAVHSAIITQSEAGLPGPKKLEKTQRGRGLIPRIRWKSLTPPVTKQGRDSQTRTRTDLNLLERRWYTQLKRLQDLKARIKSTGSSPLKSLQIQTAWGKLLSATALNPGFRAWWDNANHSHAHFSLPEAPPCSWEIDLLVEDFAFQLEIAGVLIKNGNRIIRKAAHEEDPNLVFKILAKPRVPAPSVLSYLTSHQVTEASEEGFKVSPEFSDFPVFHNQGFLYHAERSFPQEDGFWEVPDHPHPEVETEVHEQRFTADTQDCLNLFVKFWSPIWNKPSPPSGAWEKLPKLFSYKINPIQFDLPSLTVPLWNKRLQKMLERTARSSEGIFLTDLLNMPDCLKEQLILLLIQAE